MANRRPLPVATIKGKRTVIVPTLADAMFVGRHMAEEDGENEDDGAQDAAVAFLDLQKRGVNPIPLLWLRAEIMGTGTDEARAKRSKPLREKSAHSSCEQLPEWAQ